MAVREGQVDEVLPVRSGANRDRGSLVAIGLLLVAGLALFWVPLRSVRLDRMNGYGLISVLPIPTLVGAFLLTVAFFLTLGLSRPRGWLLALQIVSLVFMLHGLAPALEDTARPVTAWQHAGLVEYIQRTGTVDGSLDARFSWPGFFALVAFVLRAAGIDDIEPVMHWTPVVSELLYVAAMYLILRVMWANWRAKWFTAWLLVAADWVGQDYFSPQGFAYVLYLVFLGILLNWFMPSEQAEQWVPRRGLRSLLRSGPMAPGERPVGLPGPQERIVLLVLLVVIFFVATASHQLTPYVMLFAVTGLVLVRRCSMRMLPVLFGVIIVSWVSFMTVAYWSKQTGDLFSGLGALVQNITGGVSGRVTNGSPELAQIQMTRVLIAVVVVSLAFLGLVRRRRWRFDDRVALVLLFVPFLTLGLQNYGGEITLRVYFFVLPGACLLMAYLFFPTAFAIGRPAKAVGAAMVCGLLLVGSFLFVRFGNENFEQVRPGEVQAFETIVRSAPQGKINLVWLPHKDDEAGDFPQMPWGLRDWERFDYSPVRATTNPADDLTKVVDALQQPGSYFITTRGEEAYNQYDFGQPVSYTTKLRAALAASPDLRPVVRNADADVYTLKTPPAGPSAEAPKAQPFSFGDTRWTPVGLFAAALLIIILITYEVSRLRRQIVRQGPGGSVQIEEQPVVLRGLLYAVVPLLVVLALVILERFDTLGT